MKKKKIKHSRKKKLYKVEEKRGGKKKQKINRIPRKAIWSAESRKISFFEIKKNLLPIKKCHLTLIKTKNKKKQLTFWILSFLFAFF